MGGGGGGAVERRRTTVTMLATEMAIKLSPATRIGVLRGDPGWMPDRSDSIARCTPFGAFFVGTAGAVGASGEMGGFGAGA
jgi:hypothetical protein